MPFDASRVELPGSSLLVTTARHPSAAMLNEARYVSHRLAAPLLPRGDLSIAKLLDSVGVEHGYVVARENGGTAVRHELVRRTSDRRLFVHPRQWRLAQAAGFREAPLARALWPVGDVCEPRHIIDATAGLGGTALRIAHTFGCRVTAVEVSAPLACLLEHGMRSLASQAKPWAPAARRVDVVHDDAAAFLAAAAAAGEPSALPDAVYLNPCMDVRRKDEEDAFLQEVARCSPISAECLESALTAATRRVVLRLPAAVSDPRTLLGSIAEPIDCVEGKQSTFWVFDARDHLRR